MNLSIHINVTRIITSKPAQGKGLCNACFLFVTNNLFCLREAIKGWTVVECILTLIPLPSLCLRSVLCWKTAVCFSVASYGWSWVVYRSCSSNSSWKAFCEPQFSAAIWKTDSKFPQAKNRAPALLSTIDPYVVLSLSCSRSFKFWKP